MTAPVLMTDHPVGQCIDLRKTFANKYRYEWDPAYHEERPDHRSAEAAWLTTVPCKLGKVFPWGGRMLAACCDAGPVKRRELVSLSCVQVVQGSTECPEVIVAFDVADMDQVAVVMKPRVRRRYSAKTRAVLAERLNRVRPPRKGRLSTVRKDLLGEQETSTQVGLGVTPSDMSVGQN